ncbi:hypothetical protein ACOMHN_033522 [Nucella lapillus]
MLEAWSSPSLLLTSPQTWVSGTEAKFLSPPKSLSPKRRITRRSSVYVKPAWSQKSKAKSSPKGIEFKIPSSSITSLSTARSRQSSVFQQSNGESTASRRSSVYRKNNKTQGGKDIKVEELEISVSKGKKSVSPGSKKSKLPVAPRKKSKSPAKVTRTRKRNVSELDKEESPEKPAAKRRKQADESSAVSTPKGKKSVKKTSVKQPETLAVRDTPSPAKTSKKTARKASKKAQSPSRQKSRSVSSVRSESPRETAKSAEASSPERAAKSPSPKKAKSVQRASRKKARKSSASPGKAAKSPASAKKAAKSPARSASVVQSPDSPSEAAKTSRKSAKSPVRPRKGAKSPVSLGKAAQSPETPRKAKSPVSSRKGTKSPVSRRKAVKSPASLKKAAKSPASLKKAAKSPSPRKAAKSPSPQRIRSTKSSASSDRKGKSVLSKRKVKEEIEDTEDDEVTMERDVVIISSLRTMGTSPRKTLGLETSESAQEERLSRPSLTTSVSRQGILTPLSHRSGKASASTIRSGSLLSGDYGDRSDSDYQLKKSNRGVLSRDFVDASDSGYQLKKYDTGAGAMLSSRQGRTYKEEKSFAQYVEYQGNSGVEKYGARAVERTVGDQTYHAGSYYSERKKGLGMETEREEIQWGGGDKNNSNEHEEYQWENGDGNNSADAVSDDPNVTISTSTYSNRCTIL